MATSQALLKWNDGRFINLIKYLQEFESSMEFWYCNSNADKGKLYESAIKGLAEVYEDETDAFE